MESLFELFNQKFFGKAKIVVIGSSIRNKLAVNNNWHFPDLIIKHHLDVLIEIPSMNEIKLVNEILNYFKADPITDLCYSAVINGLDLEFIGVIINKELFSVKLVKLPARPDLTIERFGYYNTMECYDESGNGFSDFNSRELVLMNNNLFLQKYLKVMSLKFQTGFNLEDNTAKQIYLFENNLNIPEKRQKIKFDYNNKLFKSYKRYDPGDIYRVGIHVALMYLRARSYEEVTDYIHSRYKLKKYLDFVGVDYHNFEIQLKNKLF